MKTVTQTSSASIDLPAVLRWWCNVTSPEKSTQPQWREELASLVIPIGICVLLMALPTAMGNSIQTLSMSLVLGVTILALMLKKQGQFVLAGLMVVFSVEVGLIISLITTPVIGITSVPLYALLVQPCFLVIAFFSPVLIFILCAVNVAFILISFAFLRLSPELMAIMAHRGPELVAPMVVLQVFISLVTWLLMTTLLRAMARIDRAEEVVELERRTREQQERELLLKAQLEEGIRQLLISLNTATTQGDFNVRVPLPQENILWRVGHAVNNLLARLQRFKQEQAELERTRAIAVKVVESLRSEHYIRLDKWSNTSLDPVVVEVNKLLKKVK